MRTAIAIVVFALFVASPAYAGPFNGSEPLLCSVHRLFECDPPNGCIAVTPGEVRGVSHLDINFAAKTITRAETDSTQRSAIRHVEMVDGKLVIQGSEDGIPDARDGAGWTISVMDPEGTMVLATAADGFGIIGLGACAPKR